MLIAFRQRLGGLGARGIHKKHHKTHHKTHLHPNGAVALFSGASLALLALSFVLAGAVQARNSDIQSLGDDFYRKMHARDFQLFQPAGGREIGSAEELQNLLKEDLRRSFGTAASQYINRSMRWSGEQLFGDRFRSRTNLRWDIDEGFRGDFQLGVPLLPPSFSDDMALQLQTGLVLWEGHRGNQRTDINIGLVGRYRVRGADPLALGMGEAIYGINLFYDINAETELDRLGIGVDLQAKRAMLAFNSYFPVDGSDWSKGEDGYEERAVTGFELRGRYEFIDNANLHLTLGMWQDTDLPKSGSGADDYAFASKVGADWWFHPNFGVNAEYEYGPYALEDGRYLIGLEAQWPGRALARNMGSRRTDLFALVERENRILYQERKRLTFAESERLATGLSVAFSNNNSLIFVESANTADGLDITINRFSLIAEAPADLEYIVYTSLDESLCTAPCQIPAGASKAATPADFTGRAADATATTAAGATGKITIAEGETSPPANTRGILTTPHALSWLSIANDGVDESAEYFLLVIAPTAATRTALEGAGLPGKAIVRVVQIVPPATNQFSAVVPQSVVAGGQGSPQLTGFSFTATDPLKAAMRLRIVLGRPGTVAVSALQSGGVQGQSSGYRRVAAGSVSGAEARTLAQARLQAEGIQGQSGGASGQQEVVVQNRLNTCSVEVEIAAGQTSVDDSEPIDLTQCYNDLGILNGKREELELRLDIPLGGGPLFAPEGNKINGQKTIEVIPPADTGDGGDGEDDDTPPADVMPMSTEYEEDSEVTLARADANRHTIALALHGAQDGKFAEPQDASVAGLATVRLTLNARAGDNGATIAAPDIPVGTTVCYETYETATDGSATSGEDFTPVAPDSDNSHCVAAVLSTHVDLPVRLLFDGETEEDETFGLRVISIDENAAEDDKVIDTTIFGTDDAPGEGLALDEPIIIAANGRVVLVSPPEIVLVGEQQGTASLAVALMPNALPEDLVLNITTSDVAGYNPPVAAGPDEDGRPDAWDYALGGQLTIPAGATGGTVEIELRDDNVLEGSERVAINFTYPPTFSEAMQEVLDPAVVARAGQDVFDEPVVLDIGDDEGPVALRLYRFKDSTDPNASPNPSQDELISEAGKILFIDEPSGSTGALGPKHKFYYRVVSLTNGRPVNMPTAHFVSWIPDPSLTNAVQGTDYTLSTSSVTISANGSLSSVFEVEARRNESPEDKRIFNRPDIIAQPGLGLVDIIAPTENIQPFEIIFADQDTLPQLTVSGPRADGETDPYTISTAVTTPLEFAVDEDDGAIFLTFNLTKGFKTADRKNVFRALAINTEATASTTDTVVRADFLDGTNGGVTGTNLSFSRPQLLSVDGRNICNGTSRNGCSLVWRINDDALTEDDEVFYRTIVVEHRLHFSVDTGSLSNSNFGTPVGADGKVKIPVKFTIKNDDIIERFVLINEIDAETTISPPTFSVPEDGGAGGVFRIAVRGAGNKPVIPAVPLRFKYSTTLENAAAAATICTSTIVNDALNTACNQTGTFTFAPGESEAGGFFIAREKPEVVGAVTTGARLPDEGLFFKVFEVDENNVETRVETSGSSFGNEYKFDSRNFFDGVDNHWRTISGEGQNWALLYSVDREFRIGGYQLPRAVALTENVESEVLRLDLRTARGRNAVNATLETGVNIGIPISVAQPSAAGEGAISVVIDADDDFVRAGTACANVGACVLVAAGDFTSGPFKLQAAADANTADAEATLIFGAPVGNTSFAADAVTADLQANGHRIPITVADKDSASPTLRVRGDGEQFAGDIVKESASEGTKLRVTGRIVEGEFAGTVQVPVRLSKAFANSGVSLNVTPSLVAVADGDAALGPRIDAASVDQNSNPDITLSSTQAVVLDNNTLLDNITIDINEDSIFENDEVFILRLTTSLDGVPNGQTAADVYAGLVGDAADIVVTIPSLDNLLLSGEAYIREGKDVSNGVFLGVEFPRLTEGIRDAEVTISTEFTSELTLDDDVVLDVAIEHKDSTPDLADDAAPDYRLVDGDGNPTDELVIPSGQTKGSVSLVILADDAIERSASGGYFEELTVVLSYPEDLVPGVATPNGAAVPGEEYDRLDLRVYDPEADVAGYLVPYLVVGEKDIGANPAGGDDIPLGFKESEGSSGQHAGLNGAAPRLFEDGDTAEIYYRLRRRIEVPRGPNFNVAVGHPSQVGSGATPARGVYLPKAPSNDLIINLAPDPKARLATLAQRDRFAGRLLGTPIGNAVAGVDYVISNTSIRFPSGSNAVSDSFTITALNNNKKDVARRRLLIGIESVSQNGTVLTEKPIWMQARLNRDESLSQLLRPASLFIVDDDTAPNLNIGGASAAGYIGDLRAPTGGATIEPGATSNTVTPRKYAITSLGGEGSTITLPVGLTDDFGANDISLEVTATLGDTPAAGDFGMVLDGATYEVSLSDTAALKTQTVTLNNANKTGSFTIHLGDDEISESDETVQIALSTALTQDGNPLASSADAYIGGQGVVANVTVTVPLNDLVRLRHKVTALNVASAPEAIAAGSRSAAAINAPIAENPDDATDSTDDGESTFYLRAELACLLVACELNEDLVLNVAGKDSTEQAESFRFGASGDFAASAEGTLTISAGNDVGVLAVTYKDDAVNQETGANRRLIFEVTYPDTLPAGIAQGTPGGRVDTFWVELEDNENPPGGQSIFVLGQ